MRKRLSRLERTEIAQAWIAEHGGVFDPAAFIRHVAETGEDHPAYSWFTWNDKVAADAYRLDEARAFVSDLRISFKVETIEFGPFRVRTIETPLLVSPMDSRANGGGYIAVDKTTLPALATEGATALGAFIRRYRGVLVVAGCDPEQLEDMRASLLAYANPAKLAAE